MEPIQNFARVGVVHFMAFPELMRGDGPILETLKDLLIDTFFDAVEVTRINDRQVRRRVRELTEQAMVTVVFGAQPILLGGKHDLNSELEKKRREAIEAVKDGIDQAEQVGAQAVAVLAGKDPGPEGRKNAISRLKRSLSELCDYADSKGLMLVLETFDRVSFGKNCLVGPSEEACELAERMRRNHRNFGLMLDLSHLPLLEEPPEKAPVVLKDFLVHAHIGNCVKRFPQHPAYGDEHPRFGTTEGEVSVEELQAFLSSLLKIGYLDAVRRPILSFEVKPQKGEKPEIVLASAKRFLAEAWRRV